MSSKYYVLPVILLLTVITGKDSFSEDWPLFWPARFDILVGVDPRTVAVGDFDKDGKEDLAVPNANSGDVAILMGVGNGSFGEPAFYEAGDYPLWIAIGDFNEDGDEDLAVVDRNGHNVAILLGRGDGSFWGALLKGVGNRPRSVVIGDFNED